MPDGLLQDWDAVPRTPGPPASRFKGDWSKVYRSRDSVLQPQTLECTCGSHKTRGTANCVVYDPPTLLPAHDG